MWLSVNLDLSKILLSGKKLCTACHLKIWITDHKIFTKLFAHFNLFRTVTTINSYCIECTEDQTEHMFSPILLCTLYCCISKFPQPNQTKYHLTDLNLCNHKEFKFNPFPNKPFFLRVCSTNLVLKKLWDNKKFLILSNFSLSHSFITFCKTFCHFHPI